MNEGCDCIKNFTPTWSLFGVSNNMLDYWFLLGVGISKNDCLMLSIYVFLVRYSRYRWDIFGIICDITVWVTWSCKWHSNKLCVRQKEARRGLLFLCLKFPWVYFKSQGNFWENVRKPWRLWQDRNIFWYVYDLLPNN